MFSFIWTYLSEYMLPSTYVNVQKPWLVNQPQSITSFLCFTDGIHDFLKASSHFLQTYNLLSLPITICPHWFCSTPCYSFMSAWNFFFLTDKTTFLSLLEIQLHCFVLGFFFKFISCHCCWNFSLHRQMDFSCKLS